MCPVEFFGTTGLRTEAKVAYRSHTQIQILSHAHIIYLLATYYLHASEGNIIQQIYCITRQMCTRFSPAYYLMWNPTLLFDPFLFFSAFFYPGQWKGVHSLHFLCTTSSSVATNLWYHKSLYKEIQYLCESVKGAREECHQAAVCSFPVTDSQCNPALSKLLRLVLKPLFLNLKFSSLNLECSVMISQLLKIKNNRKKWIKTANLLSYTNCKTPETVHDSM